MAAPAGEWLRQGRCSRLGAAILPVVIVLLCGCAGNGQNERMTTKSGIMPEVCRALFNRALDRAVYQDGLREVETAAGEPLRNSSRYALNITLAENLRSLEGCVAVRYTNRESVPLDEVYFLSYPNATGGSLTIGAIGAGEQAILPDWQNAYTLRVNLPESLPPGGSVDIWLTFRLRLPKDPGGNYGLLGYSKGTLLLNNFYPLIPVYDENGWNLELPPSYGDSTYLDTAWYLVQVSAPKDLILAASGVEIEQMKEAKRQIVTFAAGPARDFYLAGLSKAEVFNHQAGEVNIRVLAGKEYRQAAERMADYAAEALTVFSERFGPYPGRELEIVLADFSARGMEYPGVILIARRLAAKDDDYEAIQEIFLEAVVVHEVAHQWFYNLVGNDQVDQPWLDEAFAQYAAYLYFLDRYGVEAANRLRSAFYERWYEIGKMALPIGMSVAEYGEKEYVAVIYGRAPLFLLALEKEMGKEIFADFLSEYVYQNIWGIATTEKFRQMAETHCGCSLEKIFREWVYP